MRLVRLRLRRPLAHYGTPSIIRLLTTTGARGVVPTAEDRPETDPQVVVCLVGDRLVVTTTLITLMATLLLEVACLAAAVADPVTPVATRLGGRTLLTHDADRDGLLAVHGGFAIAPLLVFTPLLALIAARPIVARTLISAAMLPP